MFIVFDFSYTYAKSKLGWKTDQTRAMLDALFKHRIRIESNIQRLTTPITQYFHGKTRLIKPNNTPSGPDNNEVNEVNESMINNN